MVVPSSDDLSSVLKFVLFAKFFNDLIYVGLASWNLSRCRHNVRAEPMRDLANNEMDAANVDAPLYCFFEF